MFISADGAAYDDIWYDLWPYWVVEPPDHPSFRYLDLFQFQEGLVATNSYMGLKDSFVMIEQGCFPVDGCPELREIVDRYLAAWSSRDESQVTALYTEDAVFSDSMFGMEAVGSGAIASLADQRFGSIGDIPLEEMNLYVQTNGRYAPTNEQPEMGRIVGVGILYRWNALVDGESTAVESITTFDVNPQGLITREEVFHDPDSLVAAGLAP